MAQLCKGAIVYILADNDESGRRVANIIQSDLQGIAKSAKVIVPVPDILKADISDYFAAGHGKAEFESLLQQEEAITKEKPITPQGHQNKYLEQVLNDLRAEQYETSDKGFGRLFADVFKDKHRYNPSRKDFMKYDGKRWIDDIEGLSARASAKALSDALVKYAIGVDPEGKYLKAVAALCNIRNRNNMLQDSKDVYFFDNEQLDTNDYFLNVQNGTLDLSEDKPKFMKHSPNMLLSKICNTEYNPAADCKEWKKFLMEIMQNDIEKMQYLQKIAGLSLTGNTEQETCFILYGSTTRNGKSTFCETLIHLLGDYALTMKPESLAVKQNLDSRQASGDIARLAGCRFCNASEPPKRMLFDTALLKSLLGRDSITARHLHQREFSFIPKFKLVINTNYLPTITDDTVFSSGRINVISFDRHFEPQEQDKDLKNRLRDKQELSGILNWCIEGLKLYRKEGLKPPIAVQTVTNTYRTDSDKIGNFINECLTKTGKNSKAKDVYEAYTRWCEDNGYGCENKGNFFAELKTKGLFMNSGTVEGKTARNIVRGYTIETDFTDYDAKESLPFE
ncbi:MAG: DNA primase [Lachnospiraceae bacterium]